MTGLQAQVDAIIGNRAYGGVAARLLANGMDVKKLRANTTTLRHEEWQVYDKAIVDIARPLLVAVNDLRSRNLVLNIDGMAATELTWETISDMEAAQVDMTPQVRSRNDQVQFVMNYLPLPIIHAGFNIDVRKLNASRRGGQGLDVTQAQIASRKVAEKAEEMLLCGLSSYKFGDGTLYGYCDFPSANTGNLSHHWDDSGASGTSIIDDVLNMMQDSMDDYCYGPWGLYVPHKYAHVLNDDHKTYSERTVLERLVAIQGIQFVRPSAKITSTKVALVPLTGDQVELVQGLDITNVPWEGGGGFVLHHEVMAIMVPRLKADQEGRSGIVIYSES